MRESVALLPRCNRIGVDYEREYEQEQKPTVSRRTVLATGAGAAVAAAVAAGRTSPAVGTAAANAPEDGAGYPMAWFFRGSERTGNLSEEAWVRRMSCLGGIEGKVFREEPADLPDERNRRWFGEFAREHRDQVVLAHFNGKGRRPALADGAYSAGHWLHYAGTQYVHVADPSVFRPHRRPGVNKPDDIVMVPRNGDGSLAWGEAEEVAFDPGPEGPDGTIRVRRGTYTEVRPIPRGSYIAAHVRFRNDPI